MNFNDYSSAIKKYGLMLNEIQIASKIYIKNNSTDEIIEESIKDNIFFSKNRNERVSIANKTVKRLQVLDDFLIEELTKNNYQTNCIICLYSLLKTDRLFFEFCNEILKDVIQTRKNEFKQTDILYFLQIKSQQSEKVKSWSEDTKSHIVSGLVRPLIMANIITKQKNIYKVFSPICESCVRQHIIDLGDSQYLEILGV